MNTKVKNKYAVPALDKGLDILEYLAHKGSACSQSEIAAGLNRSANEIYRVLVGLDSRGYLIRDEFSGRYSLSLKLYNLSRSISPIDQVRQCAIPYMEDLAVSLGQSCYLTMLYQSQAMTVVQARSHSAMHLSIAEGSLFTLSKSTAGQLLLAYSNEDVRSMLIEHDISYSKLKPKGLNLLRQELDDIVADSQLVQSNPLISGVDDFSVPIGQPNAKLIAALSISSFDAALTSRVNKHAMLVELKSTATKITSLLNT
ncbi:IclR family transcriptional regulator [Pseudoalteromonas sp. A601]|uniref:IclR family transcriptional regulator n=1 Tax=Pseudoalteromonas sp. A601 TaxID=1967839 RepID=UPI000B3C95B9|nr:helix-turn-helix domain-containing protein [Pseudoalteromonas sp. A601]OUS69238.1 IclR family transcriptional regulator [Pseudoalteromonas sp. A601]